MSNSCFKCPLLKRRWEAGPSCSFELGRVKKKRLDDYGVHKNAEVVDPTVVEQVTPRAQMPHATTVDLLRNGGESDIFFNVLWRRSSCKKKKTWIGDGILVLHGNSAHLHNVDGVAMGKTICKSAPVPGSLLSIGGTEIEIGSIVLQADVLHLTSLLRARHPPNLLELDEKKEIRDRGTASLPSMSPSARTNQQEPECPQPNSTRGTYAFESQAIMSHFKCPLARNTVLQRGAGPKPTPRHDPHALGALVMKRPETIPITKQIIDVVVDPLVSKHLRKHQREGVKFMYECVMGMRPYNGRGMILADEMGTGKSLQVIALLWTMLKQNPIHGASPTIKKAVIVCPVTLISNWRKEFRKWLGDERVGVLTVEDTRTQLTDFTSSRNYNIMIVGYERLRTLAAELKQVNGVDIVVADEGHRLKSLHNKSAQAIKQLQTDRIIILSGTPLQNDLSEFYFMVDFVNPGVLGKINNFKKVYQIPILKSRQPNATRKEDELGEERNRELATLTGLFILRRTAEVISAYLPAKTEYVLFCKPTSIQAAVYRGILTSPVLDMAFGSPDAALQLITLLKKVCNSPNLLKMKQLERGAGGDGIIASLLSSVPPSSVNSPGASGKLQVLDSLLHRLRTTTQEKVIIVSHYTATLDLLESFLESVSYSWARLDGSTPNTKRADLVESFNRADAATCFAFLLSAKAGGTGINLIGASRLILFDLDWNPSTDLQAMARIHRDGQKRPCKIYRLILQGAIDEKIYQRQLTKLSLSNTIVDNKASVSCFTSEELRNLFDFDELSRCQTHDLIDCQCAGQGKPAGVAPTMEGWISIDDIFDGDSKVESSLPMHSPVKASQVDMDAQERLIKKQKSHLSKAKCALIPLMQYQHIDTRELLRFGRDRGLDNVINDDVLLDVLRDRENRISYTFVSTFHADSVNIREP